MKYIKGPDFPTGGIVVNKDDLINIYETGQGKIKVRGKVETEEMKGGEKAAGDQEIPYTMIGAGIGKFLNDVAGLVENKENNRYYRYFKPIFQRRNSNCVGIKKRRRC